MVGNEGVGGDTKEARMMWETPGRQEGRESYMQANKTAKKAVV